MENNGRKWKKWKTMEKWKKWKTMARDRRPGMPLNNWEMEKMENNGRK